MVAFPMACSTVFCMYAIVSFVNDSFSKSILGAEPTSGTTESLSEGLSFIARTMLGEDAALDVAVSKAELVRAVGEAERIMAAVSGPNSQHVGILQEASSKLYQLLSDAEIFLTKSPPAAGVSVTVTQEAIAVLPAQQQTQLTTAPLVESNIAVNATDPLTETREEMQVVMQNALDILGITPDMWRTDSSIRTEESTVGASALPLGNSSTDDNLISGFLNAAHDALVVDSGLRGMLVHQSLLRRSKESMVMLCMSLAGSLC